MKKRMQPGEIKREWESFDRSDRRIIVRAHARKIENSDHDFLFRIFEVTKPKIVLGKKDGTTYLRIAAESVDHVLNLIKNYL